VSSKKEVDLLGVKGRIFVDGRCGVIEEEHIAREPGERAPAQEDREHRDRVRDRRTPIACSGPPGRQKDVPELEDYITDVAQDVNDALDEDNVVAPRGDPGLRDIALTSGLTPT